MNRKQQSSSGGNNHGVCDYARLVGLPIVEKFERAFSKATGIALKLVPPDQTSNGVGSGTLDGAFHKSLSENFAAGDVCRTMESEIRRRAGKTLVPQCDCFAVSLQFVAAPLVVGDRHVATWVGGRLLSESVVLAECWRASERLAASGGSSTRPRVGGGKFNLSVVDGMRTEGCGDLLRLYTQSLVRELEKPAQAGFLAESKAVSRAKAFIHGRVAGSLDLSKVAIAARLSPSRLRAEFRKATGMTVPEYVASLRLKRARTLVEDFGAPLSQVGSAVGFETRAAFLEAVRRTRGMGFRRRLKGGAGSVPNRWAGMWPTKRNGGTRRSRGIRNRPGGPAQGTQ
jgi:AraC-like DNA-binding protein/ligand-binding sensor protein